MYDRENKKLDHPKTVDLAKQQTIYVKKEIRDTDLRVWRKNKNNKKDSLLQRCKTAVESFYSFPENFFYIFYKTTSTAKLFNIP